MYFGFLIRIFHLCDGVEALQEKECVSYIEIVQSVEVGGDGACGGFHITASTEY